MRLLLAQPTRDVLARPRAQVDVLLALGAVALAALAAVQPDRLVGHMYDLAAPSSLAAGHAGRRPPRG